MGSALEVFSDLSERLKYNLPDFPLYVQRGELKTFDRYAAACHWHPDLEFILILEGAMEYFVNGRTMHIGQGDGIFVNSKRPHYGYSTERTDCVFLVVAVHPSLLGEGMHACRSYLENKFGADAEDFILLTAQTDWQRELLLCLNHIYEEMNASQANPLRLLALSTSLCADMLAHVQQGAGELADLTTWIAVWNMTGYIRQHYEQKITLDEIAAAGSVCRSRCCDLFAKYVGQTPNNFLVRLRIHKGCQMLRETKRSICEIALACGFQSASYFTYTFRREMGMVPQEYRRQTT
jgi:AraC family transcriptional regulator, melibiose operon regulatory protein